MLLNKIDFTYCLVVFFVVCLRLRPFWSVFGELALVIFQRNYFGVPVEHQNNSAGKLPPASIPPQIQSRDVAVPCLFTGFAIPPTGRSLAKLLSLARSASEFRTRLFQTAVDSFTDRIVCRVTRNKPGEGRQRPAVYKQTNKQTNKSTMCVPCLCNLYVNLREGINCYKSLPKQKTIIEDLQPWSKLLGHLRNSLSNWGIFPPPFPLGAMLASLLALAKSIYCIH